MKATRRFSNETLDRLRALSFDETITLLGIYAKDDPQYSPVKNRESRRIHISVGNSITELIVTEQRWYDTRLNRGGCGAIDLTMHLYREAFPQAVKRLDGLFASPDCRSDQDSLPSP